MNATTYKEMIDLLNRMLDEGDYKPDDVVLWDVWNEEDYMHLVENNISWADVAKRVARKGEWFVEEMSQYLIETADYIEENNREA